MHDLRRGQRVQPQVGEARLEPAEQLLVVVDLQLGVVAALQQDLVAAQLVGLADLLLDRLDREHVALVVVRRAVERAERAERVADVRVVDVAVDHVGHDAVVVLAPSHQVRQGAEPGQVFVPVQQQRLFGVDARAVEDLLVDRVQPGS